MALSRSTLAALFVALLVPACAPEGDEGFEPIAEQGLELVAANGTSFNGTSFNGTSFNGTSFNGVTLNGTSFNGTSFNGTSFNGTSLDGSELVAIDGGGNSLRGAALVGAELPGQLSSGGSVALHVEAARTAGGIWFYEITYPTIEGPQPLCGLDANNAPIEAIPLAGRWDYRQGVAGGGSWINDAQSYTLACRGAVLAKCTELGYKPWAQSGSTALRPYHQACTRMMRADYCGDGTAYTMTGTPINV
nr:ADYC domain-containing protein [Polyangiaceae bacterium]